MRLRPTLLAVLAIVAAVPLAAQAMLFKWIDDQGVVNYGDAPPAGAKKVTRLDEATSTLSVVPGIPKEEIEQLREREMQSRVVRLERELDELRARGVTPPIAAPVPYDPRQAAYPAHYAHPVVIVRKHPQHHRRVPLPEKPPPFKSMVLER